MAGLVQAGVLWEGSTGAELRAAGPHVQLVAAYLWTVAPPYGLFPITDNQLLRDLALDAPTLASAWGPLARARLVLEHDGWVWLPVLTLRQVQPNDDPVAYGSVRAVAARKWFCGLPLDTPFREDVHAQFAESWGLPALNQIEPRKSLVTPFVQKRLDGFALAPADPSLLFPDMAIAPRELFEAWWKEYPAHRRFEKVRAWATWSAILPKINVATCEAMIALLRKQRMQPNWLEEGGKFVPYPARYLSRGRWMEEVHRVASLPRVDVDNATTLSSWLESKKRKALHE